MSAPFKVGEVVIGQSHMATTDLNGMEGEVIGGLMMRTGRVGGRPIIETRLQYLVRWADGREWNATPQYLRRRKPPAADSNERMYVQKWRDMAGKAPQRQGETV